VATGAGAEQMTALSYPMAGTLSVHVLETGVAALVADMTAEQEYTVHLSEVVPIGALMALPLAGSHGTRGVLLVARLAGRPRFTDADLEMATTFANHAAIALELADARADQQRVVLLEDRDRIARDLHDHVIQRLFGAGLTVESVAASLRDSAAGDQLAQVVGDIDDTIRQIRTSIFRLRGPLAVGTSQVRLRLMDLIGEVSPMLGFEPQVTFAGSVELLITDEVLEDLEAVLREGLTNVARHAKASQVQVAVVVGGGELRVEIIDNGVGLTGVTRRSGLANLRHRAETRGGRFELVSPVHHPTSAAAGGSSIRREGTLLRWRIPLESR
jgi:signal transduction histidine kinase